MIQGLYMAGVDFHKNVAFAVYPASSGAPGHLVKIARFKCVVSSVKFDKASKTTVLAGIFIQEQRSPW